ncbi:unnamed protein product [Trichogramma brassicae]|uniref:Uncharacterized protein n=1 Tax=Trichogramma brassicae TaxID=86971 RepID=A0A6H5IWF1_9HYME|nr:unnamed protein product [Trichogramma brassicae]
MSQENQIDGKSHEFLHKLFHFISDYEGQLPNLRDIFRPEAIDWLITKSMKDSYENQRDKPNPVVDFAINSGYKDEPKVGEDGKPLSRHTTPVHLVFQNAWMYVIPAFLPDLFKIYDRFDVNYTDENGFTHFHAACMLGCTDVVEKFLELGQDPNCPAPEMGDSPLSLAVINDRMDVFKLLLRSGADPNLANAEGLTPLHCIITCQSCNKHDFLDMFFKINKEAGQPIEVDARDKKGRTPLELALTTMLPRDQVSTLLDNGADLSSFIFPSKTEFIEELKNFKYDLNAIFGLLSGAMAIVEQLEKRGYELSRSDALTIMTLFKEYKLLEKSKDNAKLPLRQLLRTSANIGKMEVHAFGGQLGYRGGATRSPRRDARSDRQMEGSTSRPPGNLSEMGNRASSLGFHEFSYSRTQSSRQSIDRVRGSQRLPERARPRRRRQAAAAPYHDTASRRWRQLIDELFEIYHRLDANYVDEAGFTHFHAACQAGRQDLVLNFSSVIARFWRYKPFDYHEKKYGLFKKSEDFEEYLFDDEEFLIIAKKVMISSSLSFYDLIWLGAKEIAKLLITEDYFKFWRSSELWEVSDGPTSEACIVHLSEKISRGFFRRWAVDSFMELTHYKLPILCSETIIEQLKNEDLWKISLSAAGQKNQNCSKQLNEKVDRDIDEKSHEFLRQLYSFICNYKGQLPNLRDIFRPEAIEWLLTESIKSKRMDPDPLVHFVINSGYKDEPVIGEGGKPSSRRTTPIHHASRISYENYIIPDLFKIYDRYDVNYTDEDDYTHFHIACENDCDDVVEKFLEHGVDPNCLEQPTGESPLHLALLNNSEQVFKLLLRSGADPNLANAEGSTPLHMICRNEYYDRYAILLFEISQEKYHPIQVGAVDESGDTPLHLAVAECYKVIESLLRRGADPNAANAEGLTPLHIICKRDKYDNHVDECHNLLKKFFDINDDMQQTLRVDARDELGRTPLQLAVANLLPDEVDVLLNRGAHLSSFVFPTENYFSVKVNKKLKWMKGCNISLNYKLSIASGALGVVRQLEKRGYELKRNEALSIMTLFDKYGLFEKSEDFEDYLFDDEEFLIKAREIKISSSLSFYDLIWLGAKETAKLLTTEDYFKFWRSSELWEVSDGPTSEACILHLSEKISRGFFRRWAVDSFMELTHYKLPILCSETIIEQLKNEDLWKISLSAAGQKVDQVVEVDARDESDSTPLELAVVNIFPDAIDVLLDHGADLSDFVFPSEDDFDEELQLEDFDSNFLVTLASGILAVVERLEKRGYEFDRSDAMTIMKVITKYGWLEKSDDIDEDWYDDEEFAGQAKEFMNMPDEKRREFFRKLYTFIRGYKGELPNLRDIFRTEAIDGLLTECAENNRRDAASLFDFVIHTDYKDEPDVGEDGKPKSRRTTAIHRAAKDHKNYIIPELFKIYDRFDVNYTDEDGLSHFHIACVNYCDDVVEKFLEHGVDPNCLEQPTGESPLHLALIYDRRRVFELLLRHGANPNLANSKGSTPLHTICRNPYYNEYATLLFEISQEKYHPIQLNAMDESGNTPLHLAVAEGHCKLIEALLRRGADPNAADAEGSTPLHYICQRSKLDNQEAECHDLAELFFEINDKLKRPVKVDAKDKLGRTSLQLAVANLLPDEVDILLNRGADLSSFVFPTAKQFDEGLERLQDGNISLNHQLSEASGALGVVKELEKRGYQLDLNDALLIMRLFVKYRWFGKSDDINDDWYDDDEEFATDSKQIMISSSLSLHDLIQLEPTEVTRLLNTTEDHFKFWRASELWEVSAGPTAEACAAHLCEKISRGFFRTWAMASIMELMHHRLPYLSCHMVIKKLNSNDMWRICLAAAGYIKAPQQQPPAKLSRELLRDISWLWLGRSRRGERSAHATTKPRRRAPPPPPRALRVFSRERVCNVPKPAAAAVSGRAPSRLQQQQRQQPPSAAPNAADTTIPTDRRAFFALLL